jgi:NTP pyrophosphatase (non-canonical NTP hydrolase)
LKSQLANELVDVIHYAFAIAALNKIDLNDVILEKDKKASIKYHHERSLERFLSER